jgi:2-polyprenyl-6-methoxyphenol hydroxylase-like FAD-dependent oxidoreductase
MTAISTALVVGAGPAGLSTAIALRALDVAVDVVELAGDRSVIGSELLVSSPALRALESLGVAADVAGRGTAITSARMHAADGTVLGEIPFGRVTRGDLPAAVGLTRAGLQDALYDRAAALGARIRHGLTVTGLSTAEDGVTASFTTGPDSRHDLVVGADGINSAVRALLLPAEQPTYTGEMVFRARVPRRDAAGLEGYAGPGLNAGYITVSDDTAYIYCLVGRKQPEKVAADRLPELLRTELAGFGGTVGWARERLGGPDTIHFAPVMALLLDDPWYRDRTLLIGDAAHATPPHIGYGAGLAVEDGVVLGECLAAAPSLADGLKAFAARRYARCATAVNAALAICGWQLHPDPAADPSGTLMRTWHSLNEPS